MSGHAPELSVLVVCYNQVPFIAEAVHGILQQIGEPFEVIVADDASTDGTRELAIRHFATRPDIAVRFLPSGSNLGPARNYFRGFDACRTPFLATLDGDDYWTDPAKLATQARFLRKHPDCPVCATNFLSLDTDTGSVSPRVEISETVTFHAAADLIADNIPGNLSTCMYRRSALEAVPSDLRDRRCGDWLLNICVTRTGKLAFLHKSMSVYRRKNGGIWTTLTPPEQFRLLLDLVPEYNAITFGTYQEAFAQAAAGFQRELDRLTPPDGTHQ